LKLLLDQNTSYRLVDALSDIFPDSEHVRLVGLATADDEAVWTYAAANNLLLVSKDSDFRQRSFVFGPPPKVVWVALGNCSTDQIEAALRQRRDTIEQFAADPESALLVLP
jgi:predicted nuclease of predicted toxin-antitoxin system